MDQTSAVGLLRLRRPTAQVLLIVLAVLAGSCTGSDSPSQSAPTSLAREQDAERTEVTGSVPALLDSVVEVPDLLGWTPTLTDAQTVPRVSRSPSPTSGGW